MMGHTPRYMCGGAFLFWNVLLVPCLLNVALHTNGYPLTSQNSSSSEQGLPPRIPGSEDDMEPSSEEQDEDELYGPLFRDKFQLPSFRPSQPDFGSESNSSFLSDFLETTEQNAVSLAEKLVAQNGSGRSPNGHGVTSFSRQGRVLNAPAAMAVPKEEPLQLERRSNPIGSSSEQSQPLVLGSTISGSDNEDVKIIGLSIDYDTDKRRVDYDSDGSPTILEGLEVKMTLYGRFTPGTKFRFSKFHWCDDTMNNELEYEVYIKDDVDNTVAIVYAKVPEAGELNRVYLCLRSPNASTFKRQGESKTGEYGLPIKPWLVIKLSKSMFPLYLHVLFIVLLLTLSGLFSGLNLGLMSLDKTDLKIIMNTGSKSEKQYAQSIAPVRNHGNFLLCCLLFSNVLVNATLTILVDDLTTGLIAIAGSTLAIVIFGEIIPQAICSRYGLAVGAKTIYITKFFMFLTSPMAFPLSKVLDKLLGEEIGNIYTRDRLKELLKVTKDHHGLETEEVGIISGALDLKLKTVKDVMVRLDQIFMLPADTVLDFDTMAEIEYQGYSRIPVYDGERSNVVALINVRQLTLLDASDNIPLRTIMDYYKTNLFFVFENTHLDFMFKAFREGSRGHMAFVQRVNDDGPGDPYYETVGMLTMEDVLEEILQADIRDENDVEKVNARTGNNKRPPAVPFTSNKKPKKVVEIPATLALAATQFMSTSVDPFKYGSVSVHIIQRLLRTNVQFIKAPKRKARQQVQEVFLYENGKAADSFIMILEGRVQVTVGKERLMYEAGPFNPFGTDFLMNDSLAMPLRSITTGDSSLNSPTELDPSERPSITSEMTDIKRRATFVPDYSVKVLTDVYFLRIRYDHYRHALAASELERVYASDPDKAAANVEWQDEIEKVLNTGDDEEEMKEDDADIDRPNIIVNGRMSREGKEEDEKENSTSTETDESDNKDSDHDENHPTEVTKLLPNNIPCS